MKAYKLWHRMVMVLFVLFGAIYFTSCGKDDDKPTGIVGTWTCSDHYYGGIDTYIFKSNGTYTWSYSGTNGFPDDSGNYAFDSSRSTLTIHNKKGTTWVYIILSLTSNSFTLMDEDGDTYYYSKK